MVQTYAPGLSGFGSIPRESVDKLQECHWFEKRFENGAWTVTGFLDDRVHVVVSHESETAIDAAMGRIPAF